MNKKVLAIISILAIATVFFTLLPYAGHFGNISSEHERWGQFGDYVGGLLNPLFALAAFLAALYTVFVQGKEFKRNEERSQKESLRHEMLAVMRLIDSRVISLLSTDVGVVVSDSPPQRTIDLHFNHMLSEAQRISEGAKHSPGFDEFVAVGKSSGSTTEAIIRELLELTLQMKSFIAEFERSEIQLQSPFLAYYSGNMAHLCTLLQHFDLADSTQEYFISTVRRHRVRN